MSTKLQAAILEIEGAVARITINNPEKRNCLSKEVRDALAKIFEEVSKDDSIKVVTTTGAGDIAYCAGQDLHDLHYRFEHPEAPDSPSISEIVRNCPKVTLAIVNGYCLGAGVSTLACHDLAIASVEKAQFGLPEIMRDFVPKGAVARIFQSTNRKWAMEMLLTGKNWNAERALVAGLVNRVVPHAQLQEAGLKWAREIAQWDANTLMYCKKAAQAVFDAPTYRDQMEAGNVWHKKDINENTQRQGLKDFISGKGIKANLK